MLYVQVAILISYAKIQTILDTEQNGNRNYNNNNNNNNNNIAIFKLLALCSIPDKIRNGQMIIFIWPFQNQPMLFKRK